MKTLLLSLVAILLCGCNVTRIAKTDKDGNKLSAFNARGFWKSGPIQIDFTRTNDNVTAGVKIDGSGTDTEALKAVVDAAVKAGVKAAIPAP